MAAGEAERLDDAAVLARPWRVQPYGSRLPLPCRVTALLQKRRRRYAVVLFLRCAATFTFSLSLMSLSLSL
jgi:hypothetical protein